MNAFKMLQGSILVTKTLVFCRFSHFDRFSPAQSLYTGGKTTSFVTFGLFLSRKYSNIFFQSHVIAIKVFQRSGELPPIPLIFTFFRDFSVFYVHVEEANLPNRSFLFRFGPYYPILYRQGKLIYFHDITKNLLKKLYTRFTQNVFLDARHIVQKKTDEAIQLKNFLHTLILIYHRLNLN